ncbi:MAG: hypothetical protein ONB15_07480 [candidate division KSB1 bacterium]|nr:hypothetical protein [candidate division KSB1 bacterium]
MKRARSLPAIERFTLPSDEWPFDLLPHFRHNTNAYRTAWKPAPGKTGENLECAINVYFRRSSHADDCIHGEYLDVSSEDHLVVFQKDVEGPISYSGETFVRPSQSADDVPWEEMILIKVEAERRTAA